MKNVIKFLLFIIYSSSIFFLPNNKIILFSIPFNLFIMIITKVNYKKIIKKSFIVVPFIFFTFIINCILDNIIYSETTNITRHSRNNKNIMYSFKNF